MSIHFGTPNSIKSIRDAVLLYANSEFESATRSTIPMLTLLKHYPDQFNEIVRKLTFPGDYDLFLEYTVGPFGGLGKPSHTDVMIKSGRHSLAIEGKWTEPMYAAVKHWPKKGATRTPNQNAVLDGWLSVLAKRVGNTLDVSQFDNVIYQMIHRAASASFAGEHPRLAYFLFKPSPYPSAAKPDDIHGKLSDLWNLLGKPTSFPFYVVEIETKPLDAFEKLRLLKKGEEATTEAVCAALQDTKPLFHFGDYRIRRVGQETGK